MQNYKLPFVAVVVALVGLGFVFFLHSLRPAAEVDRPTQELIAASGKCAECHYEETAAIAIQYGDSRHAEKGVTCLDCHQARKGFEDHAEEHHGFVVTNKVTSGACAECHPEPYREFERSRHALPAYSAVLGTSEFTDDQVELAALFHDGEPGNVATRGPNGLAQLEGDGAAANGCMVCHEIGRPNYDGSIGDCSKCHLRHEFSIESARLPYTCGSCHMGPDHAQLEIWQESKHGVAFMARREHQDLTVPSQELTTEDQDVPTCSTCHMSGLNNLGMTHDVGERLSLYLFAPITEKREGYEQGRINMQRVCTQCHSQTHVDEFYAQADGIVETVNARVRESKAIYADLLERGLVTPAKFDEPIEFTEFNLWHHWGRTAKHGSFMGGADFVQWHGNYELLKDLVEMRTESAEMIEKAEAGH